MKGTRRKFNMHTNVETTLNGRRAAQATKSPGPPPPGSSAVRLSQADKLAVNLL